MAFFLINTEVGGEDEVWEGLRKIKEVEEVYIVYGVYDIIAKAEVESMGKLDELVTSKLRRLEKVRSTLTMIVSKGP